MTARDEMLIALWQDDVPISEIAETLDMTTQAVHGLACRLRQLGHDLPRRTTGPRPKHTRCGTPYEQMLAGTWKGAASVAAAIACVTLAALPTVAAGERLGARYTVESTAYSLCSSGSTMANGRHVRWGAIASNMLALGTRIKLDRPIVAHRADGKFVRRRYFTVADRIGYGTDLDVFMPSCGDAIDYGRRVVTFRVMRP